MINLSAVNPVNANVKITNLRLEVLDEAEQPLDGDIQVDGAEDFELAPLEVRQVSIGNAKHL